MNERIKQEGGATSGRGRHRWASFKTGLPLLNIGSGFSVAAEQYRKLALRVEEAAGAAKRSGFVVVVTSPDAGAGKTTTSLNLALTVARGGEKKVLVIESDLWKPKFETMLTMSGTPIGLSDMLLEDSHPPIERCAVSVWSTGLDIIVGGGGSRNGDLTSSQRMGNIIKDARGAYDVIILDSPPFALASGRALVPLADGVLIVARIKNTRRRDIEELLKEAGQEKTLGIVLNNVRGLPSHYSDYSTYQSYSEALEPLTAENTRRWKYPKVGPKRR